MEKRMTCPECKRMFNISWAKENKVYPFCSELCQKLDLYKWLNEEYYFTEENPHTNEGD